MKVLHRLRRHKALRFGGHVVSLTIAILCAAVVTTVTVDLGPSLRVLGEQQGSKLFERPIHIGALKIRLITGKVEVDDLVIEGTDPTDRPFFTAKQIALALDWSRMLSTRPELIITGADMRDWKMLVERWENRDNFVHIPRTRGGDDGGERRFTTTLKYFHATGGEFTYEDHATPWSIWAPNLTLNITNFPGYHGDASFKSGLIAIQDNVPMWADFKAYYTIDGGLINLQRIDLVADGSRSLVSGRVDMAHWPEQTYQVKSSVDFPRMREVFFSEENWRILGEGRFNGVFHLFKGGHDLAGDFTSDLASVNEIPFPALKGSLHWTSDFFEVTKASASLYGGMTAFDFGIRPLGKPERPTARFDVSYSEVDLAGVSDFFELKGIRFASRATGRNRLEWPLGRFSDRRGDGTLQTAAPAGTDLMVASLDAARADAREWGPFAPAPLPPHVPIAGRLAYRYAPDRVDIDSGEFITGQTHVAFSGRTAWGDESAFRFHVVSRDWQESDQLLAGIITDFGSPTGAVTFGGRGEFDGTMTGPFRRPRVEGHFTGEDLRAWDTMWGAGTADIVIENQYVTIANGLIREADSEIQAEGAFSLGYPREDGGEEINARFRVTNRPLDGLRHAFKLDDWPVSGRLNGEFRLNGEYERPLGSGAMTIDRGVAYREPFDKAASTLRFDGRGVRLDAMTITKSDGAMTGAAFVGWDGTYSFNVDGRRIQAEHIAALSFPKAQPTGIVEFTAAGSGLFEDPRYDVRFRFNELFVADEPVGLVTGTLALRGQEIDGELEVASPRLAVTGTGRIALDSKATGELTFRFHDSSLDPYVRLFVPKLSPYTKAVASGSVHVIGELTNVDRLLAEGTVDRLDMTLFDYAIRNARPIRLALDQHVVRVQDLQLVGDETQLTVGGTVSLHEERIALRASGDASLGILQGFFKDVRGAGRAELTAAIDGPLYDPVFSGSATIENGRVRHFSLPNSLDAINGSIRFDSSGVRLDDVSATMGGGSVKFGGRIGFDGYLPGDLNVSVRGEDMHLRYPEGIRSTVDADLVVRGNFKAPTIGGRVLVKSATWDRRIDPNSSLLDFGGRRAEETAPAPVAQVPLRFDIEIVIPSTLRVENNLARLVASADLQLRGTYDRPIISGRAQVDRGEVIFEGRRYLVTRGNIDFTNPTKIEPFFDIEAETRVRVPGQTYQVTVRAVGTIERLQPELTSDPPLPAADVLALLFSDTPRSAGAGDAELRALRPEDREAQQLDLVRTRVTQVLANETGLSQVGRIIEQSFGVDTFQLTPSFIDPYSDSSTGRVNPSARVTIGKRVSDRVYLTFSRNLSSSNNDQIVVLEYDVSDRFSWVLSRNEDSTFAIEIRVRRAF